MTSGIIRTCGTHLGYHRTGITAIQQETFGALIQGQVGCRLGKELFGMTITKYNLGDRGIESLRCALTNGRALSSALSKLVEQIPGEIYTLLPQGLPPDHILEPKRSFRRFEGDLADNLRRQLAEYEPIDVFVSAVANLVVATPTVVVWTEDYFARPGDPVLCDQFYAENKIQIAHVDDTVTYLVPGQIFSRSSRANQIARRIRSMSVWNGVILRKANATILSHTTINADVVRNLLSEAVIIFAMAYEMDGFVFFQLSEGAATV